MKKKELKYFNKKPNKDEINDLIFAFTVSNLLTQMLLFWPKDYQLLESELGKLIELILLNKQFKE